MINLANNCDNTSVEESVGVEEVACSVGDGLPVSVTEIQIWEISQPIEMVNLVQFTGIFETGDVISYTSIINQETTRPIDFPRALQIYMLGLDGNGNEISFAIGVAFTNDCTSYPVLSEGQTMGWVTIVS